MRPAMVNTPKFFTIEALLCSDRAKLNYSHLYGRMSSNRFHDSWQLNKWLLFCKRLRRTFGHCFFLYSYLCSWFFRAALCGFLGKNGALSLLFSTQKSNDAHKKCLYHGTTNSLSKWELKIVSNKPSDNKKKHFLSKI